MRTDVSIPSRAMSPTCRLQLHKYSGSILGKKLRLPRLPSRRSRHRSRPDRERILPAATAADAELIVLNTCTVTATADDEVRQTVRRMHRDHPHARILITDVTRNAPLRNSRLSKA